MFALKKCIGNIVRRAEAKQPIKHDIARFSASRFVSSSGSKKVQGDDKCNNKKKVQCEGDGSNKITVQDDDACDVNARIDRYLSADNSDKSNVDNQVDGDSEVEASLKPSKKPNGKYKCEEYFHWKTYSYYDIDSSCAKQRLPQSDAKFKLPCGDC